MNYTEIVENTAVCSIWISEGVWDKRKIKINEGHWAEDHYEYFKLCCALHNHAATSTNVSLTASFNRSKHIT